ncbi:MAG TPA: PP2C family protein-serine/threonine phosphatase [Terracidiphilus sp.]|nr:PP2C family protein-serine/threonine phosphatase [Terracidiphilus sp.]
MMECFTLVGLSGSAVAPLLAPMSLAERMSFSPYLVTSAIDLCLAVACLALWRAAPDYPIFRIFGAYLLVAVPIQVWTYMGGSKTVWPLNIAATPLLVATAGEAMRVPYRLWVRILCIFGGAVILVECFGPTGVLRGLPIDLAQILLAVMIVQAIRRKAPGYRYTAAIVAGYFLVHWLGSPSFRSIAHVSEYTQIGGWRWSFISIALTLLAVSLLSLFVRELIFDRREKLRLDAELESARAVQQVLIPEDVPPVPGFTMSSVYKPAGQVGGDFFQTLPIRGGGVLIVIGDVSGKGMPAAMTVSLLVGTMRTLAHYTQSPREILAAMNQRMLARSRGGFTTCLVLRADADGKLTVANAGHIAPYLNGKELTVENGLPIGISADACYAETIFHLMPDQQLTLLTDGVVEARDKEGKLLGFERTAQLSMQPAEAIARAAQEFGQDDDITVLTLVRTSSSNTQIGQEALSPA